MNSTETMRCALLALEDAASVIGPMWADSVARKPMVALRAKLDQAADDVDILAEYSRQDGRREWVNVGVWLRPGEVVLHTDDPRATAQEAEIFRRALHEIAEEWAGAECGEPAYAQEAYAIGLAKRMYELAADALRPNTEAQAPARQGRSHGAPS